MMKMIDDMDFPMDYGGGSEPPLSYEEILEEITESVIGVKHEKTKSI